MLTKAPRGTRDILPGEVEQWQYLENKYAAICRLFGYSEIRIPVFEHTELFLRSVGEGTDIVSKEMYTFIDRGERSLTLRPEGTASIARAYLEHRLDKDAQPVKLYYQGPMFRYDRPQAGRYRQFHQFGVEAFGSGEAELDAEVIELACVFFRELGLKGTTLQLNSVGCPECREVHRIKLKEDLLGKLGGLCPDCVERYGKNPLRILDCKNEKCGGLTADAPVMQDFLCGECAGHFVEVQAALTSLGEEYTVNPRLVRGLDYYTRTVFEIVFPNLGAQSTICGGGRYDLLLSALGGPDLPGIGLALGLERLLLALAACEAAPVTDAGPAVFVAMAGGTAAAGALRLLMDLRAAGVAAEKDYLNRSLKAQFKYADKKKARFMVILGDEEIKRGQAAIRDMKLGTQEDVPLADLVSIMVRRTKEAN